MAYLDELGFKIYRLREARTEKEFLIYNIKKDLYNVYSQKRCVEILLRELQDIDFNIVKFAIDVLGWDGKKCIPYKITAHLIQTELQLIDDVGFRPVKTKTYELENKKYFNCFNLIPTLNSDNYKDKEYSFEEFKKNAPYHYKLFSNLHNFDEKAIQDTLLKIADKIHYPDDKAQDCIIFYPGEGAGKGIFYKYIIQPIFAQYSSKVLMKKLNSDFNGFLKKTLILILEEGKRDPELVETLKEVITEGQILINEKGTDQYMADVYFLTFVFSNNMNPIDLGKRRGSYHLAHSLGKDINSSQDIGKELCDNLPNETQFLLKYLHNLDFEHQKALKPFNTIAKAQVTDLNKTPLELFYDYILTCPSLQYACTDLHNRRNFKNIIPDLNLGIQTRIENDIEVDYIKKDSIKDAYNNFCFLEGFKSNLIRHNKDIVQLWALFKIPDNSHIRILLKDGVDAGRKLDHIKLKDINDKITEGLLNE